MVIDKKHQNYEFAIQTFYWLHCIYIWFLAYNPFDYLYQVHVYSIAYVFWHIVSVQNES